MPLLSESENHYNMKKYLIIIIYLIANTLHAQYAQGILLGAYAGAGMNDEKLKASQIGIKLGYQFFKGIEVFGELFTLSGGKLGKDLDPNIFPQNAEENNSYKQLEKHHYLGIGLRKNQRLGVNNYFFL
jgi:hypothetical protein